MAIFSYSEIDEVSSLGLNFGHSHMDGGAGWWEEGRKGDGDGRKGEREGRMWGERIGEEERRRGRRRKGGGRRRREKETPLYTPPHAHRTKFTLVLRPPKGSILKLHCLCVSQSIHLSSVKN